MRNFRSHPYAWPALLVLLTLLECMPFWAFQYFPSQDGPSHLYNASILANYEKQIVYQDYYSVSVPLDGNLATQAVTVGLLKAGVPPQKAQTLLLTAYAVLFPLCLWYLLTAINSDATAFSLFAILFIPNFFLHKGFWNFCIGVPLALLAMGYYVKHRERWSYRSIVVFAALGGILYLTHIVAWASFAIAAICYEVAAQVSIVRGGDAHSGIRWLPLKISKRQIVALCTLIPPGLLTVTYSFVTQARSRTTIPIPTSLLHRLRILCSLSFLHTLSPADIVAARLVALMVALLFLGALVSRFRFRYLKPTDAFVAAAAICAALAVFGPDTVGDGSYIHLRVSFFALIFLVVWLAAQRWSTWTTRGMLAAVTLIAIVSLFARLPEYRRWNDVLYSFTKVGRWIGPGAAVLTVKIARDPDNIDPLTHAVDLLTPKPFIDLCNYEAGTDQFPLHFRPNRSPNGPLGRPAELEHVPPTFNIPRYEAQTLGCVNYVLVHGAPKFVGGDGSVIDDYQRSLPDYSLIYASDNPLKIELYMRRKSCR